MAGLLERKDSRTAGGAVSSMDKDASNINGIRC